MRGRKSWLIALPLILIFLEYYSLKGVNHVFEHTHPHMYLSALIVYGLLVAGFWWGVFTLPKIQHRLWQNRKVNILIVLLFGFLIARLILSAFVFSDDIRRVVYWVGGSGILPYSALMARIGLIVGVTMWAFMFTGLRNQYRYQVKRVDLKFDNFPAPYKGMKIVHISDIHVGSFANDKHGRDAVSKGIDMILKEQPDVVVFTGDLVNNISREILYFKDLFRKVQAPIGVYSILGNHDYGDYVTWPDEKAKQKNFEDLKRHHAGLGWRLLLNENRILINEGASIAIIGVENWSAKGFQKYGDLKTAYGDLSSEEPPFKILLTHDPSHWEAEVLKDYPDINLTLSGHTHGMQFGFRLPGGIRFSPARLFYKQWGGLYKKGNQYLYVNTGFGFLGFPGRIGLRPEITVLTLS